MTKGRRGSLKKDKEPRKKPAAGKRKNGTKSKDMVESEDDGAGDEAEGDAEAEAEGHADDDDAGPSKKTSPPPAKKVKRDKEEEVDDGIVFSPLVPVYKC